MNPLSTLPHKPSPLISVEPGRSSWVNSDRVTLDGSFWLQKGSVGNTQARRPIVCYLPYGDGVLKPRCSSSKGDAHLLREYGAFSIAKTTLPTEILEVPVVQLRENKKLVLQHYLLEIKGKTSTYQSAKQWRVKYLKKMFPQMPRQRNNPANTMNNQGNREFRI